MNSEQKGSNLPTSELINKIQQTRNAAAEQYKQTMIDIHFSSHGDDTESSDEEPRLVIKGNPHQPGVVLYRDGSMEEVNHGIYTHLSEPRPLEGTDYIKASETIFQSILPQEPKLKNPRCI